MNTRKVGHYIGKETDTDSWVIAKDVISIKPDFFDLLAKERRVALRMIIWWSIKQYFK
jgi:hypothetical protein